MMIRTNITILLAIAIMLMFVSSVLAIGLGVDPGAIIVNDVPLGEKVAVSELSEKKMKLKIQNRSESAYSYTIEVLSSDQVNAYLTEGCIDIPDTSWIIPENKEIRISKNGQEEVELYLMIPDSQEYYNKKYQAIIEVKSKKNRPQEIFVLACQLPICFSTYVGTEDLPEAKSSKIKSCGRCPERSD